MAKSDKRKSISLKNQLHAALLQLGMEPHEAELDHSPALGLRRVVNLETGELDPAHDDPKFLIWRPKAEHRMKTTGRRGESKLSKRGGDISEIAKLKRLEEGYEAFRRAMLTKAPDPGLIDEVGEGIVPPKGANVKRPWPKRSFEKRKKLPKPGNLDHD